MKLPARIKWKHVQRFYEAAEPYLKASPLKLDKPDSGRVLVLAPHIDDDVIGAGGSLRKHIQSGDDVLVVYFADCTDERIKEAKEATGIIGINRLEFLGYRSKTLLEHPEIRNKLSAIFDAFKPDIVYLPSIFDRHNDHLAVNHYLLMLYEKHRYNFTVYAYEVWTAFLPNLIIDISDTIEKKKEAISCFKSQLTSNNWLDAAVSLNRYRGVTSGKGQYAEGFIRYSIKEYSALYKKMYGK